jgi:hypothetical protein
LLIKDAEPYLDLRLLGASFQSAPLQFQLDYIAKHLGFQTRNQYESAVRKLLMDDAEALEFVRGLFGALPAEIGTA